MPQAEPSAAGWLQYAAQRTPQSAALVLADGAMDFSTVHSLTAQVRRVLAELGLQAGAIIIVESRSSTLLAFLLYAALESDYRLFPLDPQLPEGQRRHLLQQVKADLRIVEESNGIPNTDCAVLTATALLAAAVQAKPLLPLDVPVSQDRARLMLATSGSSGVPGLVQLTDYNLAASARAVSRRLKLSPGSVWLDCLPLVHISGLAILLRCVSQGAAVVLEEDFDAGTVLEGLRQHKVTHVSLVPVMLAQLLDLGIEPPPQLEVVLIGGAALDAGLARQALLAGWPVWVSYGLTETASMVAGRPLVSPDDDPRRSGPPLEGVELRVVDRDRPLVGEEGLIQVRGAVVQGAVSGEQGRWYATGDRGSLNEAGELSVAGRNDEMLLSGGEKVHPEAVEQLLVNCPGVDEVAVTGRADRLWGEIVVAVYRGELDEASFEQLCREGIQGVMRPRLFLKVDALPRTANGKLDRAQLRRLVSQTH